MNCPKCGNNMGDFDNTCKNCGRRRGFRDNVDGKALPPVGAFFLFLLPCIFSITLLVLYFFSIQIIILYPVAGLWLFIAGWSWAANAIGYAKSDNKTKETNALLLVVNLFLALVGMVVVFAGGWLLFILVLCGKIFQGKSINE